MTLDLFPPFCWPVWGGIFTATVVGDRSVEYNGETMSLTALAKLLTGKQYSIAGPRFFKYKGEWLNDIRHRIGV